MFGSAQIMNCEYANALIEVTNTINFLLVRNVSQPLRWGLPVTNNVADFAAIIRAVTMVKEKGKSVKSIFNTSFSLKSVGMRRLVIYSNSHYLNASIKGYVKNWFCNGWELLNGEPVKHKKLFRKYFRITEDMSVRLVTRLQKLSTVLVVIIFLL